MRRLAGLIHHYGKAIEADLPHYYPGIRLGVEWRARRWRELLNLIDHLPRQSLLWLAIADDEELAESMAERAQPPAKDDGAPKPPLQDWTMQVDVLAAIYDRLGSVIDAVVASAGGKPPRMKPMPRPETATDRAQRRIKYRRQLSKHRSIVDRVLPNRPR